MTRHLKSCMRKAHVSQKKSGRETAEKKTFHIMVEGRYQPEYWMHLAVSKDATLEDLDEFLRETWLECCGHMSAFTIGGARYVTGAGIDSMWIGLGFASGGEDMDVPLGRVLTRGLRFLHEYDFGTTTKLTLKVVAEPEGETGTDSIEILARNNPPLVTCDSCEEMATQVCTQCVDEGKGWLCDACAKEHECGDDQILPLVNSPRCGICGYTG
jgi:hypothetical protein